MDRQKLIISASEIPAIETAAVAEYELKANQLAGKVSAILSQRADIISLIGPDNLLMMQDNHSNHARFISSILKNFDPEVLTDTILWVFRAYRSHGFTSRYWAAQLNAWIQVLNLDLSPNAYQEIYPLYEWMQVNIPMFTLVADTQMNETTLTH